MTFLFHDEFNEAESLHHPRLEAENFSSTFQTLEIVVLALLEFSVQTNFKHLKHCDLTCAFECSHNYA